MGGSYDADTGNRSAQIEGDGHFMKIMMPQSAAREAVAKAMRQSARTVEDAAAGHFRAFTLQMQERVGVERIALDEPYLPFLLARGELECLRRLERLEMRLGETKVLRIVIPNPNNEGAGGGNGIADEEEVGDENEADDDDDDDGGLENETGIAGATDGEGETDDEDGNGSESGGETSLFGNLETLIDREINHAILGFKQGLDSARQQAFGITHYIWEGGDCPLCAPNNGQIFTWGEGDEPGDVHPNCDCSAEPILEEAGDPNPPEVGAEDIAEVALLLLSLTPAGLARRLGIAAMIRLGRIGQRILDLARVREQEPPPPPKPEEVVALQKPAEPTPTIFERPKGVPKDWKATSTKDGKGIVYEKPGSRGASFVKTQKGTPESSQPGQRYDNVRWTRNGQSLDKNGNIVPKNSQESHIPLEEFKFDPEIFK